MQLQDILQHYRSQPLEARRAWVEQIRQRRDIERAAVQRRAARQRKRDENKALSEIARLLREHPELADILKEESRGGS